MSAVAPNLQALIGEIVGSKLIAHAGGLTALSKYPASTIQILGAEKALFRALKTRGKTPKYGLLFNSTFIGRAGAANKGKISRYLANKCAIASRIDCFSDHPTAKIGESLRDQVEERLKFVASGVKPRKNKEAMKAVLDELKEEGLFFVDNPKKANSIVGCKKSFVYVVYTRWKNLKKTNDMVDGQVGFHRPENVRRLKVEKDNTITNAINKTKVERHPDLYKEQQDRQREIIRQKKEKNRQLEKERKLKDLEIKKEKEERSYGRIMTDDNMTSNKDIEGSADNTAAEAFEDDFSNNTILL